MPSGNLGWLGTLLYLALFLGCGLTMMRAQMVYVALHRRRANRKGPLGMQEIIERHPREPLRWMRETPRQSGDLWKLVWQRQDDPELERARRRVVRWWWLTIAALVFGFPVMFLFTLVRV